MKIVSKTYLLIAVLIGVAAFNLFLLYQEDNSEVSQSYSILKAGDVKVKAESISGLATSVANGNIEDRVELEKEINEVQNIINALKNGGEVGGQTIEKYPSSLSNHFNNVDSAWDAYRERALTVEKTSVFDQEATSAMNYVLQKNQELVLYTDGLVNELQLLDRNYNPHKDIAEDMAEGAKIIGQQTLLISIGEEEDAQKILSEERLKFEIGMRKLLQITTAGLDVQRFGYTHDTLDSIPRENSESLRKLDPLWESVMVKIETLEERALLSPEFNDAKNAMSSEKLRLFEHTDYLLDGWSTILTSEDSEGQIIVQVLLVVNIAVFGVVMFVIRQSMSPLEAITKAISRVREGVYGEKINYTGEDEVGELVGNFNIMSDTIKEKEEEARKTDIAKDEFLAMITHELKTPLVPIQGYSDMLLSEHLGKLTVKQKERVGIIKSSSESLLSLISDLLDAQKLELGQLRMKKDNANINDTINRAVERLSPQAKQSNVELTANSRDLNIAHDPERIGQVITNLIKNSLNAVAENTGKIEVLLEDSPSEIKISVKDNGVGIPQDKQKDLFKKFYQVDASHTREKGGSGLGLAICKGIIDSHGGQIYVNSIPNQGATFSFTLPKDVSEQGKLPLGSA